MKRCPIRVVMSESVFRKQKMIRDIVICRFNGYESVLELGGCVHVRAIIITDALIPHAQIGPASFHVKDRDLSACWEEAGRSPALCHVKPVGDLHYHPEQGLGAYYSGPSPSSVDIENSLRQAALYHVFTLKDFASEKELTPADSGEDGQSHYDIDSYTTIIIPAIGNIKKPAVLRRRTKRALWASLISTRSGDSIRANVVEHVYSSSHPTEPQVLIHEAVPIEIPSDEEVSVLTGWPIDKIRLTTDETELEAEVKLKYMASSPGWQAYQYSYPSWPAAYGYNGHESGWGTKSLALQKGYIDYTKKAGTCRALHGCIDPAGVGQLLREAACLLDGKDGVDFQYLRSNASLPEIIEAVEECLRILKGASRRKKV